MGEKKNPLKKSWEFIKELLGLYKNSPYVENFHNQANIRSAFVLSIVMIFLESCMLIRYVKKYVIEEQMCNTLGEFFHYTKNYWILLILGVLTLLYAHFYLSGKLKIKRAFSEFWIVVFAGICLYFGYQVSFLDYTKGRMFICFMTMVLYVACLLIWRPYISIILLTVIATSFLKWVEYNAVSRDTGELIGIDEGDKINYWIFFVSLIMISVSIFYQRQREGKKSEAIEKAMVTDRLTGAPNTNRFYEWALSYIKDNPDTEMMYLYVNIKNFKIYNNSAGYKRGNELIIKVADAISEVFSDVPFARQANDHFVILTPAAGCNDRVRQLRDLVMDSTSEEMYLDINVGGYIPKGDYNDPRLEMDRARYACSLLKSRPDEYFIVYDEKMDKRFYLHQHIINTIDKAVREGYIRVFYQPVVWSKDRSFCSCEALARWEDPKMGFLSPGEFIPVLEETGQIGKLDKCIIEIVCRDIRTRMDKGEVVVPVSINFSRLDFEFMDPVEELEKMVEKYDVPRNMIHVEVTESALTEDTEGLKNALDTLHEKGYSLWLDDFGSGYSALNVLKDFEFDVLKIDMVFLKNMESNEKSKKIIKSIIDLANSLGMKTLSEGVETEEAADFLESAGCGRLQGYYYGKPMPIEDLYKMVDDGKMTVSLS